MVIKYCVDVAGTYKSGEYCTLCTWEVLFGSGVSYINFESTVKKWREPVNLGGTSVYLVSTI